MDIRTTNRQHLTHKPKAHDADSYRQALIDKCYLSGFGCLSGMVRLTDIRRVKRLLGGTVSLLWSCHFLGCFLGNPVGFFCVLDISCLTRITGWVRFVDVLGRACVFPEPEGHHEGAGILVPVVTGSCSDLIVGKSGKFADINSTSFFKQKIIIFCHGVLNILSSLFSPCRSLVLI